MPEVFIRDAVRTPVGKLGGALAGTRPDDLAATVVRALAERNGLETVDEVYFGDANQAGEDNRNVARMAVLLAGLPTLDPGRHGEPVVRLRHGGGVQREPRDRGRGRGGLHRRRRGVDEPRAVGRAQARQAVPAHARDHALDHARLADGQPRHARRVDGHARRGRRDPGRQVRDLARAAGRVRAEEPSEGGGRLGPRRVRRRGGLDGGARARREHPRRLHAREARSAEAGVPQGRDGDRRQLVADERRRLGAAALRRGGRGAGADRKPRLERASSRSCTGSGRWRRPRRRCSGPGSAGTT